MSYELHEDILMHNKPAFNRSMRHGIKNRVVHVSNTN